MLVQVAIENCLSFREQVVLGMERSKNWEHPESHVRKVGKFELLRCAAMFGANASGKSNFVKAMAMARALIVEGTRPEKPIRVDPFALDPSFAAKPTRFQFIIAIGRDVYSYGFGVTRERVTEEWLFLERDGNEEAVFERELVVGASEAKIKLGTSPVIPADKREFFQFLADGTRPNQLFLCEARERRAVGLHDLSKWFAEMAIISPKSKPNGLARVLELNEHRDFKAALERALRSAGTGIEGLEVQTTRVDTRGPASALEDAPYLLKTEDGTEFEIEVATNQMVGRTIKFRHQGSKGELLPIGAESDGTRRLLELLPIVTGIKEEAWDEEQRLGILVLVDELDRSLHSLLTRHFVSLFFESSHPSQMIFTSHDANLIDREVLQPDEIWFVQKNSEGASSLFSLTEFKKDDIERLGPNLERGYLVGRFGAIPLVVDAKIFG